jgi:tetratricopeptide (TPR) repeat protein
MSIADFPPERLKIPFFQLIERAPWMEQTKFGPQKSIRPIQTASYWLDYFIAGPSPLQFHLTNLLLGFILVLAFYGTALSLLESRRWAVLATLLLTTHPMMTEPMVYITARGDLLVLLFATLALWLSHRLCVNESLVKNHRALTSLLSLTMFAAFNSKESGLFVTFVPMVFLFHYPRLRSKYFISILISWSAYFFLRTYWLGIEIPSSELFRWRYVLAAWGEYVRILFFPYDVSPVRTLHFSLGQGLIFGTTLMVGVFLLRWRYQATSLKLASTLLLAAILVLIPLSFASAYYFEEFGLMHDRYASLALIPYTLGLALLGKSIAHERTPPLLTISFVALLVIGFFLRTMSYVSKWQTNGSLFTFATESAPENYASHLFAGIFATKPAELDQKFEYFRSAFLLEDNALTRINLASVYISIGDLEEAETLLLGARPKKDSVNDYNRSKLLAQTWLLKGEIDKACRILDDILSRIPSEPVALSLIGRCQIQSTVSGSKHTLHDGQPPLKPVNKQPAGQDINQEF